MYTQKPSKTIVFIHGLFMNPKSWQHWIAFFETKGYTCYAKAYPYHEGDPSYLQKNIDSKLGDVTFQEIISIFSSFIDTLPEKPILIGHSMGGLIVQKLIEMEKGVAGICIDSAAPKGIFSFKWSFLKANVPVINPLKGNTVFVPNVDWFHYAFCHTMTRSEVQKDFDELVVPESRNIPRSSIQGENKIDFKKPHQPLLFIAGEKDHIIPASLNRKNYQAYKDKNSRTDFKEFPGRTHHICKQKGWEEVAMYVQDWITSLHV